MKALNSPRGSTLLLTLVLSAASPAALSEQTFFVGATFSHPLPGDAQGPEMVVLSSGSFTLGGGRLAAGAEELEVDIARPFAISKTEITVGMYRHFLHSTQSPDAAALEGVDDDLPISGISWDEAESFVAWLSHQTGFSYRLPSSTQWEYAARAGSRSIYSWGDAMDKGRANCTGCGGSAEGKLMPVGSFKPNGWGLLDVHGNVWEWTRDCVDPNSKSPLNGMPQLFGNCDMRELRGGSARSDAWSVRTNARAYTDRKARTEDVGMRVVMEIPL
ncbi:MAG: SUMF1/EgtB/PvdO family nonheme iron enzyme [Halioglobus sp.]|nr:SUMF1/EgtB/PvdO family nonheme iron enzyme [Halioglobus sp.]